MESKIAIAFWAVVERSVEMTLRIQYKTCRFGFNQAKTIFYSK